ncbi:MAG: hypothetical protein HY329_01425 [Chloroflexi bacterium]|nr:hypothetical protein [Chloroflexota bacterium]
MNLEIRAGATVECTDGTLGIVERALSDHETHELVALLVRHGQADYLLCIPSRFISAATGWRVQLNVRFDDVETAAIVAGRLFLDQDRITDGGTVETYPSVEFVLGQVAASSAGGPATA